MKRKDYYLHQKKKMKKEQFKQIEEQQEKLKKLQAKKEKTIKKKITDTFLFLTEEENFIKFEKVLEDESFKEKIKTFIITEMDKEIAEKEKKKKEEIQKESKNEEVKRE